MADRTFAAAADDAQLLSIPFDTLRNITSDQDKALGRKLMAGQMPARACLGLNTNENVRGYLVEAEGKLRKTPTQVHRAIKDTLKTAPKDFAILNGGLVLVANEATFDEQRRILHLRNPSIINGAQTQGVIRDFFSDLEKSGNETDQVLISFQLIITSDDNLITETSISRNYQNDVKQLSIAGRRGRFDELEAAVEIDLQKDETDLTGLPTEKLLQVITALMPEELWRKFKPMEKSEPNKVYTYSMKAKCLKEFDQVYIAAKDPKAERHDVMVELYQYYLDIAKDAWKVYNKWKIHQGFQNTGIRNAVTRDEDGKTIKEVQDGMVFPIIASLSAFVERVNGRWTLRFPVQFDDKDLIKQAIQAYSKVAHSNVWNMGKDPGCYSMCYGVTTLYKKLSVA